MASSVIIWAGQSFPSLVVLTFGLTIGSFLNVCILRIPSGRSIVRPPSHCPRCKKRLKWRDNIPLLSFLLLRGRCRYCRKVISWQYPLVEAVTGVLFLWAYLKFSNSPLSLVILEIMVLVSILVSAIDLRTYTIPNKIVFPFLVSALCFAPFNPFLGGRWPDRVESALLGFLTGGGVLLLMAWLGEKFLKQEAMGGGDIKLLASFGIFVGWERVIDALFAGSITAGFLGLLLMLTGRLKPKSPIPFGPFLCAGVLSTIFFEKFRLMVWAFTPWQ